MDPSDRIIKLRLTKNANDTRDLNVHYGVLCKSSEFFRSAMKPEWTRIEEQSDTLNLPVDSLDMVSDYIKWLYSDKVPIKLYELRKEDTREKAHEEAEKVSVLLARAYAFAEKIIDVKYKNGLVKTFFAAVASSGWSMGPKSVSIVYEGTPSTSPLRRFFAANVAYKANVDSEQGVGWMQFIEAYPRDALEDAMKAMVRIRKIDWDSNPCVDAYLEKE